MKWTSFLTAIALSAASPLVAFSPARFTPNVVDTANVLSESEKRSINETVSMIREQAGIFSAVYTVKTLGGEAIEGAATQTFEKWALGQKGKDNGLLFMLSISDRQMRLEVGYGLEGSLPDATAKRIITDKATPLFKAGQYSQGITDTLIAAAAEHLRSQGISTEQMKAQLGATDSQVSSGGSGFPDFNWTLYWLWIAFLVGVQLNALRAPSKRQVGKETFGSRWKPILDRALVTGFLALNPGVFILLIPRNSWAIVNVWVRENHRQVLHDASNALLTYTVFSPLFVVWILALAFIPRLAKRLAFRLAEKKGIPSGKWVHPIFKLAPEKRFASSPVRWMFVLPLFLLPRFLFFVMVLALSAVQYFMFRAIVSPKFYKRNVVGRRRLERLRSRVAGTREIFGKLYTHTPRSSSSSSSSSRSSSSSSSGGGRSGGGGASGRW